MQRGRILENHESRRPSAFSEACSSGGIGSRDRVRSGSEAHRKQMAALAKGLGLYWPY